MGTTHTGIPQATTSASELATREPLSGSLEASLLLRIDRLVHQAERWVWIHAISSWLVTTLAAFGILMLLDIVFRWQDPGMRWLCWIAWLSLAVATPFWWLRRAWRFSSIAKSTRRERMSLQIERLFPAAKYKIASAVAFAQPEVTTNSTGQVPSTSDLSSGSTVLRRESMVHCYDLLCQLPIATAIDRRRPLAQVSLLVAVSIATLFAVAWQPTVFSIASSRLLTPWRDFSWPRINRLQFVELPKVVAAGEDLPLRVIDSNGQLPSRISVEIQWPSPTNPTETPNTEALDMKIVDEVAQLSLPGTSLSSEGTNNKLLIRATGGDDNSMAWQEILIAKVPQIKSFSIHIEPPEYCGQTATDVSGQAVRVLAGSRITIRGEWTNAVKTAAIDRWTSIRTEADQTVGTAATNRSTQNALAAAADNNARIRLLNENIEFVVAANPAGTQLATASDAPVGIVVNSPTEIAIRWQSLDGIEVVGPKWNIQTVPDRAPTIALTKPLDEQPITPTASVPVAATVNDDLGLRKISLHWQWIGSKGAETGKESESEILWESTNSSLAETPGTNSAIQQTLDQIWQLPATATSEGISAMTLWIEAVDSGNQVGLSKKITLRFTTPEQTLSELAQRQADVRNKIEQALQQQREASLPVLSGMGVLERNGNLQQEDRDALQSAARNQKNLRNALTQSNNSVKENLNSIAEQLKANNLADSDLARENQQLLDNLRALDEQDLASAQQTLAKSNQLANDLARDDSSPGDIKQQLTDQLTQSKTAQTKITDSLQNMLDTLARSESLRQSQSELSSIARKQRELHERTEQLQRSTLLDPNASGLSSERTRVEVTQNELAREIERIQQQLREDSAALKDKAPELASNTAQLADELDKALITTKMREAKDAILKNNFDSALQEQQGVLDSLSTILDQSEQASQPTLSQLEQALSGAQQALSSLANEQQSLADSIADRNDPSSQKKQEQQTQQSNIRSRTEQVAQQLEPWLGENSLEDLLQAAEDQRQAESALQEDQQEQAEQSSQNAANRLQQSSDLLEEMTLEIQQESIADQLQQLRPLVERLYREEADLADDSSASWNGWDDNIKSEIKSRGDIPADVQQSLDLVSRQFAARQLTLRQLLARADGELSKLPAFELVTDAILADMDQAVAGFERSQYDDTALPAVQSAQKKLGQLQEAIAEAKPEDNADESTDEKQPEETEDAEDQQPPSRAPLASLKLLRSLQQDLLNETQELSQSGQARDLTASQQRRLTQLAELQQKLAEQVEALADEMGRDKQL